MLLVVEIKVAEVEDSCHEGPNLVLLLLLEPDLVHATVDLLEVLPVVDVGGRVAPALLEVVVGLGRFDSVLAGVGEGVEGVERAFVGSYRDHPAPFEQVADDVSPLDGVVTPEKYLDVFSEATGVVVADGFAVPEGLEEGVAA